MNYYNGMDKIWDLFRVNQGMDKIRIIES